MEISQRGIELKFVGSAFRTEQIYLQIHSVNIVKEVTSILLRAVSMTLNYLTATPTKAPK